VDAHNTGARVAIVTGGSRGIGGATARLLAKEGWDVCVAYRDDEAAAASVVEDCRAVGRSALAVRCDVASETDVHALFEMTDGELGRLQALVNNAGIVGEAKARVDELSVNRIQRILAVNVVGCFLCAREAVRRMSTRFGGAGGAIVNVSSIASRIGGAGEYVDYGASKGAVDTLTVGLAREVAAEGIRVNAVRPGIIDTDLHASGGQPDRAERLTPLIPMQRPGDAREVAQAIAWLCSDRASYVTGTLLDVGGGR
jgi:NAD(P)-dependent dehydrogenase (short-subunit alcohol dehydrogenase family)